MNCTLNNARPQHQNGFVVVLLIVMIALAAVTAMVSDLWLKDPRAYEQKKTREALKRAKESLLQSVEIGNNAATLATTIGGRLPCPDLSGDGIAACGNPPADALGVNSIGLLPWASIGIPLQRDGSGECLWYAVSGGTKLGLPTIPTNSDANGLFTVVKPEKNPVSGSNPIWINRNLAASVAPVGGGTFDSVVAVIIAPGSARGIQSRPPATGAQRCPLPTLLAGAPNAPASAAQYLEAAQGIDNRSVTNTAADPKTWITADTNKELLNDEIIWITASELAERTTRRAGKLLARGLQNFYAANQHYPYAATVPGGTCVDGVLKGFVPLTCPAPAGTIAVPTPQALAHGELAAPLLGRLPNYDQWIEQTHYVVSERCARTTVGLNPNNNCMGTGVAPFISVDNNATVPALILMRGRAANGATTCPAAGATQANLVTCFESPLNATAALSAAALVYTQSNRQISNDLLIVLRR